MPFGWHPRDSPHSPLAQWTAILGREAARILSFSCLSPRALGPGSPASLGKPPQGHHASPHLQLLSRHFFLSREKQATSAGNPLGGRTQLPFLRPPSFYQVLLKPPLIGFIQEEKKLPSFSCLPSHTKGWPSTGQLHPLNRPPPAPVIITENRASFTYSLT